MARYRVADARLLNESTWSGATMEVESKAEVVREVERIGKHAVVWRYDYRRRTWEIVFQRQFLDSVYVPLGLHIRNVLYGTFIPGR